MNNKPKFYRADGKFTKYAFCCGYVYFKNNSSQEMYTLQKYFGTQEINLIIGI
jgi:hypothetical protein